MLEGKHPTHDDLRAILDELRPILKRLEAMGSATVMMSWTPTKETDLAAMGMMTFPQGLNRMMAHSNFISFAMFMGLHLLRKGFPDEHGDLPAIEGSIEVALAAIGEIYGVTVNPVTAAGDDLKQILKHLRGEGDGPSIH